MHEYVLDLMIPT